MFKVNKKVIIKTPGRRQWRRYGISIVNFEHMSHLVLVFLLGMAYFITSKSEKTPKTRLIKSSVNVSPEGIVIFLPASILFNEILYLPKS